MRRLGCIAIAALAGCAGCDGCEGPPPPPSPVASAAAPSATSEAFPDGRPKVLAPQQPVGANTVRSGRWSALDAEGEPVLDVTLEREEARLRWTEGQLVGELRGGSRRYVDAPGAKRYVSKVKRRGPIAVLRGPTGEVQWRVVLGQREIRYWRGAETGEPTYVVTGDEVRRGEQLVGHLRQQGDATLVTDADGRTRYRIGAQPTSQAWAAMLFDDLPAAERGVLVAEVLVRGR